MGSAENPKKIAKYGDDLLNFLISFFGVSLQKEPMISCEKKSTS